MLLYQKTVKSQKFRAKIPDISTHKPAPQKREQVITSQFQHHPDTKRDSDNTHPQPIHRLYNATLTIWNLFITTSYSSDVFQGWCSCSEHVLEALWMSRGSGHHGEK